MTNNGEMVQPNVMLRNIFDIMKPFFQRISACLYKDDEELPEILTNIMRISDETGTPLIDANLVKGLLSIAAGKIYSVEDLADALHINTDVLELCVILSSFIQDNEKITKCVDFLQRYVCREAHRRSS